MILLGKMEVATLPKKLIFFIILVSFGLTSEAYPASKEIIRLQADVTLLQQQVRDLQKSFDTQGAVLKTLVEQLHTQVSDLKRVVEEVKGSNQQTQAAVSAKVDSLSGQFSSFNSGFDVVLERISRLSQQLAETKTRVESLDASSNTSSFKAGPPSPGDLYDAAYADYLKGNYDLAKQGFEEYLKNYPDTDLSDNAQYWIGECNYVQRKFPEAIAAFDKVILDYPKGDKAPAAHLKKAYGLLEMKNTQSGIRELRLLTQKFPYSDSAQLAKDRLNSLGSASKPASRR